MNIGNNENSIEPKENFYMEIKRYYDEISGDKIPEQLLQEIIEKVTDKLYADYNRFWNQYPKSRKRYSTLKLEDIRHSFVHHLITNLLKKKGIVDYRYFSKILFNMTDEEFDKYEEYKYLYETK